MNSRERVVLAIERKAADRIPVDFWATAAVVGRLEKAHGKTYAGILDGYGVDFRYIEGPAYIGPPLDPGQDIWGVERIRVSSKGPCGAAEAYSEVCRAPLSGAESVEDIEAYDRWPDPGMFDYGSVEQQCEAILKEDRVVVFMGDRLNRVAQLKPAMYLRGTEDIFVDIAARPEIANAIFRKIKEFYLAYLERILIAAKGKIDIVLTGDDFGAQNGLLMGAPMWRTFIKPGFADYVALIKHNDAVAMHHSCGSVVDIIPEMIECGLDILQSIQPEARGMSLAGLKARFGRDLCFQGGVSIQKTLPFGTPADIRREVRCISEAAKPDGGYIFCTSHNIQADTPLQNIEALMEAYSEYGKY